MFSISSAMKFQMMVVSALFFLMLNHLVTADERLIRSTCNSTPYKDLCISSLLSDGRSQSRGTAGLALILVEKFSAEAKAVMNIVNQRIKTTRDPKMLNPLKHCVDVYHLGLFPNVETATYALTAGNPKFAEQGARSAAAEARECEGGFVKGTSPVSWLSNQISQLAEVVASIARQLE